MNINSGPTVDTSIKSDMRFQYLGCVHVNVERHGTLTFGISAKDVKLCAPIQHDFLPSPNATAAKFVPLFDITGIITSFPFSLQSDSTNISLLTECKIIIITNHYSSDSESGFNVLD